MLSVDYPTTATIWYEHLLSRVIQSRIFAVEDLLTQLNHFIYRLVIPKGMVRIEPYV